KNLPADADVPATKTTVVPPDRGAALVKFGVSQDARNALVIVKGADGKAMPAGSHARLAEGEEAMIGYGGEVYLRGLNERNVLSVDRAGGGSCRAYFDFHPT